MEQKINFNQGLAFGWLIFIIGLASALIAGTLVFVWQKSAANKEIDKLQQQINALQTQIQQLQQVNNVNDKFADWQTYRNEEYGFEIDYPTNGWGFSRQESKNPVFWVEELCKGNTQRESFSNLYVAGRIEFVDPQCYENVWGEDIQPAKIMQCIVDHPFNLDIEQEVITEYQARGFRGKGGGSSYGRIEGVLFPLWKGGENFYPILVISYDADTHYTQENLKIFNRVVSSFRFID